MPDSLRSTTLHTLALAAVVALVSSISGLAGAVDTSSLNDTEKAIYDDVVAKAYCYKTCPGTIADCLADPDGKAEAERLGAMVVHLAKVGKDADAIVKAVMDRGKTIVPATKYDIDMTDVPLYGKKDGVTPLVTIVEYGDFQCPYCAKIAPDLHKVVDELGGTVVLAFKHFPVKSHPKAVPAAIASVAVQLQGKFWEYYFHLYKNRDALDPADLVAHATTVGADGEKVKASMKDKDAITRIKKEKMEGLKNGVKATPTFFVNGAKYYGVTDYFVMKSVLEELVEAAK